MLEPMSFILKRAVAIAGLVAISAELLLAQDCPVAASARRGFVVERDQRTKTDVFHVIFAAPRA